MLFMNIGGPEMILIFVVILLLFGGKKLPELARGLGKGLREFKDASDGIKREIHSNINTVTEAADLEKAAAANPVNNYQDTENTYSESPNSYGIHADGTYPDMHHAPLADNHATETNLNDEAPSGEVMPGETASDNTKTL
jgi:sec-independent protein translocase protein TatA